jgi:hypothetical protein
MQMGRTWILRSLKNIFMSVTSQKPKTKLHKKLKIRRWEKSCKKMQTECPGDNLLSDPGDNLLSDKTE